jgi:hypothetical protein
MNKRTWKLCESAMVRWQNKMGAGIKVDQCDFMEGYRLGYGQATKDGITAMRRDRQRCPSASKTKGEQT